MSETHTDRDDGRSRRARDRLVGAAIALAAVLLLAVGAVVALAWSVSDPVDDTTPGPRPTSDAGGSGTGGGSAAQPPSDLAPGETWLGDLVLDAGTVLTTDATLRDVEAVGQDVRSGPGGTVVGRLAVEATVPFEVVAVELGEGAVVRPAADGQASVTREVEVGGRSFTVVATGTVEVVGGLVVVEPQAVDVGGPAFLAEAVAALARELVTIEQEVEGLPEGLVLREVVVGEDGFRATLDGEDVALG